MHSLPPKYGVAKGAIKFKNSVVVLVHLLLLPRGKSNLAQLSFKASKMEGFLSPSALSDNVNDFLML